MYQVAGILFVFILLARFHQMAGWSSRDLALLIGFRLVVEGLAEPVVGNLLYMPDMIREGTFDQIVVRPASPLLLACLTGFRVNGLGDLTVGVVLLLVAAPHGAFGSGSILTPLAVPLLVMALVVRIGLQISVASVAFWAVRNLAFASFVDDTLNSFGNYPLSIFGFPVQLFLTFILPVAFLAYIPVGVLLNRLEAGRIAGVLAEAAGAAVISGVSFVLWRRGLRAHQGAGT
jgi:ABC-2 type transport system permease protein